MFPTAVSSVDTTVHRQTFLQNMDIFLLISRKDIWQIRRGGQLTDLVSKGGFFFASDHALLELPVIDMKIASIA